MFIVSSYFLTICLRSTCKTVPQCILLLVCRYAPWVQILFWCIQCMSRTYFTFTCPFGAFTAQGQWWESLEALDRDRKLAVLREMQATDANLKVPSKFPHAIWCNLTHRGVQMIVDCPGCWDDNNCGLKVPAPAKGLDWKPCRFILFLLLHPLASSCCAAPFVPWLQATSQWVQQRHSYCYCMLATSFRVVHECDGSASCHLRCPFAATNTFCSIVWSMLSVVVVSAMFNHFPNQSLTPSMHLCIYLFSTSINQPTKQAINQASNQSILNQPTNQPINQPFNQPTN